MQLVGRKVGQVVRVEVTGKGWSSLRKLQQKSLQEKEEQEDPLKELLHEGQIDLSA